MEFVKIHFKVSQSLKNTHERCQTPSFHHNKMQISEAQGLNYKYKEIRVEMHYEILVA